jgi:hypothetical protein
MMKKLIVAIGMVAALALAGSAVAGPTDAEKCAASLRKCFGKGFQGCTKCYAKEALTGDSAAAADCVSGVTDKMADCTGKALGKGGCISDQAGVDHVAGEVIDEWCADVREDTPTE